ncbi:uncharacterized protein TRUGW13939_00114 [Talaromyces rugulosus]|uniref:Uncharacterized protein n=1 Tax=Talaromyces rugulosus TaxID=121627 RepID=A0A7H8QIP0_TALRU|nr:uncharacterized protein TRUGW13939_00114 [Talaromyces rugulosus]QKX53043.1 hypothetical protein TRUGW13939_00114 [Talaromyces rugulosus]
MAETVLEFQGVFGHVDVDTKASTNTAWGGEVPLYFDRPEFFSHQRVKTKTGAQCGLKVNGITHGQFSPDGPPATLLVLNSNFKGINEPNRIENTKITFRFSDLTDSLEQCPEVYGFPPEGEHIVDISNTARTVVQKKVSLFCFEFFRVITRNEHFTGTLSSIEPCTNSVTDTVCGDGVIFLQENKGTKQGVANEFSTAILFEAKISGFPLPTPGDHSTGW